MPALPPWSRKPLWVGVGVVGLLAVIGGVLCAAKARAELDTNGNGMACAP